MGIGRELGDKGYRDAAHVKPRTRERETRIPESGQPHPREKTNARRAGKRTAQSMEETLQLRCGPWRTGRITKAILVLQAHGIQAE